MRRRCAFLHLFLLILTAAVFCGCGTAGETPRSPAAAGGLLDLRKESFSEERLFPLIGEWEIRKNQLAVPADFDGGSKEFYFIDGRTPADPAADFKSFGAATFRLRIDTGLPHTPFGVLTDNLYGASRLWLNGSLALETGHPSLNPSEVTTRVLGGMGCYTTSDSSGRIEVVFQTADRNFRDWNMTRRVPVLGTQAAISDRIVRNTAVRLFVLGGILFIFLHHLFLFYRLRKDSYNLFFSLFILMLGLRLIFIDDLRIVYSILSVSSSNHSRLTGFLFFPLVPLFTAFLVLFFPEEGRRREAGVFGIVSAVFLLLATVLPRRYIAGIYDWYYPVVLVGGLYVLKILVSACLRGRSNAFPLLIGGLALAAAALYDLLTDQSVPYIRESFTVFGILAFLLLHSLVINRRFSDALKDVELLTSELKKNRDELEGMVEKRTRQLKRANKKLEALAHRDGLTKLYNRRFFDVHLEQEWRRLSRNGKPLAIMLSDVDFFKAYNDRYGHQRGDECLKKIAEVIQAHANRPGDAAVRYGGEEFVLILPETDLLGVRHIAESILREVEALSEEHGDSPFGKVTISAGIASCVPNRLMTPKELVGIADESLYAAKQNGRNRILPD